MNKRQCFVVLLAAAFLQGCGGAGSVSGVSAPISVSPNVTGNWQMSASSATYPGQTFQLGASLVLSGSNVSGTAHISSPCYSFATAVPVSGTLDSKGNLVINSGLISNQALAFTGVVSGTLLSNASYAVLGGCAGGDKGSINGQLMAPLTGSYAGSIQSFTGTVIQVNTQLVQGTTADSGGFFHESGTAAFTGSPCFTQASIANSATDSLLLANAFSVNLTTSGATGGIISLNGTFDPLAKALKLQYQVYGGKCAGDAGSGTLVLQ